METQFDNLGNIIYFDEEGNGYSIDESNSEFEELAKIAIPYSENKNTLMLEYIEYLNGTDWVITKIQEASFYNNDSVEQLKIKYQTILNKRNEVRNQLQEIKSEVL